MEEGFYAIKRKDGTLEIRKRKPPRDRRTNFYLSKEAVKKLLDYIKEKNIRDYLLFKLMYTSALRVEEAIRVRIEDFKMVNGVPILEIPKHKKFKLTGKPEYAIVDPEVYNEIRIFVGRKKKGYVFLSNRGRILDRTVVFKAFVKYCKEAGVDNPDPFAKHPYPRLLRRSRAQHLKEEGVSLDYIAVVLRDTIKVTYESYAKPSLYTVFKKIYEKEG